MTNKEYQDKLQQIQDDYSIDGEEFDTTFETAQLLGSLKAYVDKRLDLLKESLEK
jgi:hypothetical protein